MIRRAERVFALARAKLPRRESRPTTRVERTSDGVLTVPAYDNVPVAARVMRRHKTHRVVVTHEKEVVGVVSSFDLLRLVETIDEWHPPREAMPATLVHNDFNPRNVAVRPGGDVLILDWEIARRDVPQSDVIEFLMFALPANATRDDVDDLLELHRKTMAESGLHVDKRIYDAAFVATLRAHVLDRIGFQHILSTEFNFAFHRPVNVNIARLLNFYS